MTYRYAHFTRYVSGSQRSRGEGREFMACVVRYALENDGYPTDWPLKSTNPRGIAFYASLAAFRTEERLRFRLVEPARTTLAASGSFIGLLFT
jgi:hypothetical protein